MACTHLGLTGGIGSGKSTVGRLLAGHGAVLIDADAISRASTAAGGAAIAPIRQAFGDAMIGSDGALDRTRMRTRVFEDASARARLEAIVHPLVQQETQRQTHAALQDGARLIVYDIPLLVESGQRTRELDAILVVDCRTETQIARVMARNGLPRSAVEGIIAAQASRAQRRAAADCVVYNDGIDLATLGRHARYVATRFGL